MSGLPYLPWFPGRFLSSTRGWTVTARGIYRELLDAQWDRGALPANPAELRQLIGATAAEWKCWPLLVEAKFPLGEDGQRRNPTLEEHRSRSWDLRERHRKGAKITNDARRGPKVVPFRSEGGAT
jgi:uncharacterized protein YdaU (DUF1376 family)